MIYLFEGFRKRVKLGFTSNEIEYRAAEWFHGLELLKLCEGSLLFEQKSHGILQNELKAFSKHIGGEWYGKRNYLIKLCTILEKSGEASAIEWLYEQMAIVPGGPQGRPRGRVDKHHTHRDAYACQLILKSGHERYELVRMFLDLRKQSDNYIVEFAKNVSSLPHNEGCDIAKFFDRTYKEETPDA